MLLKIVSCTTLCYLAAAGSLVVLLVLLAVYFYIQHTMGICKSKKRMDGKTVIITGCTSEELIKESGNESIVTRKLDLSSFASVREFAQQINREEDRLDVLIHNAGTAQLFKKMVTEDGLEMTMATNQYGPFLLTHLLIGGKLYVFARLNLNNVNPTTSLPGYLYYVSKYANIVFSLELARRLEGSGVTVNCLHPGLISTGIWKAVPPPFSWILNTLLNTLSKTVEQGAQTTIYLAVSDEVNEISGKFFKDCKERELFCGVKDQAQAKKFWELNEEMVKLQSTDPKI
ncbi:Retinol dehydrogenase [Apis cerana cerana]|uniref:Retinol dehydrogenase n=1 Tax=Apis cerana cerana TaxID=94128 RepID=A0A2A3E955_APICC|nr:Retinol dehydrogenase [Apis cerana cerana]